VARSHKHLYTGNVIINYILIIGDLHPPVSNIKPATCRGNVWLGVSIVLDRGAKYCLLL